jgi:hypothetical protein
MRIARMPPMTAPGQDAGDDEAVGLDLRPHQGGGDGDGHAEHAVEVAAPGGGGVGQALEGDRMKRMAEAR